MTTKLSILDIVHKMTGPFSIQEFRAKAYQHGFQKWIHASSLFYLAKKGILRKLTTEPNRLTYFQKVTEIKEKKEEGKNG